MSENRKKETCFRTIAISILIMFSCILVVLIGEWGYSEIRFQIWLHQNKYRLDFSQYDTTKELREAILTKLPIGSSEVEVQAFRQAYGYPYQEPNVIPHVPLYRSRASRGLFGLKPFLLIPGVWVIYFELDPVDYSLTDINVSLASGP